VDISKFLEPWFFVELHRKCGPTSVVRRSAVFGSTISLLHDRRRRTSCTSPSSLSFRWKLIVEHEATRVLEREAELVGRIQARWRGLSVRRYLVVFRRELRRNREVRASMIFRIQRTVRRWSHRKRAGVYRSRRAGKGLLEGYLAERTAKNDDDACVLGKTRLRKAYVMERYLCNEKVFALSDCIHIVYHSDFSSFPSLVWLYRARINPYPAPWVVLARECCIGNVRLEQAVCPTTDDRLRLLHTRST